MSATDSFNVVSTGDIAPGFDHAAVTGQLVAKLGIRPEQAAQFFDKRRIVKKGVSHERARTICGQLARLGVTATAEPASAPVAGPAAERAAAPQPAPAVAGSPLELLGDDAAGVPQNDSLECPKCGQRQPKSEQCTGCGIWFHKFAPADAPAPAVAAFSPAADSQAAAPGNEDNDPLPEAPADDALPSAAAIAAAAGAALVGAWIWKFIAVSFEYEFGLIAWAIGGAVGYAAAAMGSRGIKAGVVCGVLALGAIVLGKYWAYDAFLDDFQQAVSGVIANDDNVYAYYEEEQEDAAIFVAGSGTDAFVRRFMVDRGYTDATDPSRVTAQELDDFRAYTEPALREVAETSPDFEQWQANSVAAIGDISPWTVMREESGGLDILFALLGIGTAFRLGSRMG